MTTSTTAGIDLDNLEALALAVKGWANVSQVWRDGGDEAYVVGVINEDDEKYPVIVVDTEQYDVEGPALANFYAVANPATVLQLIELVRRSASGSDGTAAAEQCEHRRQGARALSTQE